MPFPTIPLQHQARRSTWSRGALAAARPGVLAGAFALVAVTSSTPAAAQAPQATAPATPAEAASLPLDIAWSHDRRQRLAILPAHIRMDHGRAVLAGGRPIWVTVRVPRAAHDRLPLLVGVVLQAKADELGLPEVTEAWMKNPPCGILRCKAVGRAIASPTPSPRSTP